jgi:LPS export ABC transporter protein LptC
MKAKKIFTTLSLLLLFSAAIYGGYLLLRESDSAVPSLVQPVPGARLLMSMDGFRFAQSQEGRVVWRMLAKNADLYGNKEAQLKEIEILFYNPSDKDAKLLGETGTMDTVTGNASLRRGAKEVRIMTSDGYLLTTNSLFWKARERLVWTEDPFKMLGSEMYLEGVGFSANVDLHSVVVKNNVKAVLQE